jgi:hypothetical protein
MWHGKKKHPKVNLKEEAITTSTLILGVAVAVEDG